MSDLNPANKPRIHVAAGLVLRADGALLLGQRPADKPWPGWWELPGGKLEPGETALQALARELKEEIDITVTRATRWVTYVHEYPKNIVRLDFCKVTGWEGEPHGLENQELAWIDPLQAPHVGPLLPATEPPMRWLRVPQHYLVSSIGTPDRLPAYLLRLEHALAGGLRMVQFREPGWPQGPASPSAHEAFTKVLEQCHRYQALCLINSAHPQAWWAQADGVHLRAADARARAAGQYVSDPSTHNAPTNHNLMQSTGASLESCYAQAEPHPALGLQPGQMLGVSAHTEKDLEAARRLNASFVVIGHVLPTPSHPDQEPLGWQRFAELAEDAGLPVLAIGGQSNATLETAQSHGAHGIAGMRLLIQEG
jgi:8-oxo-dGTP diphosphatase